MTENEFYQLLQRRLSQVSIGPSAIRNQGAGGLIEKMRAYLETGIRLEEFFVALGNESAYLEFLDTHTTKILATFPESAQSWGAARKGLNLFLREVVYSKFFSHWFSIPNDFKAFNYFIKFMEVPLDNDVAKELIENAKGSLPKWVRIRHLTPLLSSQYQKHAALIAEQEEIARVNLDLLYWRSA